MRIEELERFCRRAMEAAGMSAEDGAAVAEVLVTTDSFGTYTHGTKQLRNLLRNFRDGMMDLRARTELVGEGPSWATFDGHHSMPIVSSLLAMRTAISKAKGTGIACSTVRDSGHFGAAGYYANLAAWQGCIGFAMCNVDPGVAAPGSRGAVLGTNPLAYAAPDGKGRTVFLDIATSVVAAGKVYQAQAAGKSIPEGWLVDKDGLPTTDPTGYPRVGALQPMAGHKGYGLALMVEVLTGLLSGGAFGRDVVSWVVDRQPVNQSLTFVAISIESFMPIQAFTSRVATIADEIHGAPKAVNADRIYLPGEKEWENRERALEQGLSLPADVLASLEGLAADYGLDAPELWAQGEART